MTVADTDLAAENARLRAEITRLKARPPKDEGEPPRRLIDEDVEDRLKDAFTRNRKEGERIGRSVAYAAVESLHAQADAISDAADRLFKRKAGKAGPKDPDELIPGANDVAAAVAAALNNAATHGDRIVHRFMEAYDKGGKHP